MSDVTIFHNPACGTSRNTLGLIRHGGIEPVVIEYLKTPPSKQELRELVAAMGISVRALLRQKGTPYAELGVDDPTRSDEELLDAMLSHPILINRPIVVTELGTKLCRPSEGCSSCFPCRRSRLLLRKTATKSRTPACDASLATASYRYWRWSAFRRSVFVQQLRPRVGTACDGCASAS